MKNKFEISADGLIATIELKRRSGDIIHCLVDSADLPKLHTLRTTWYAHWDNDIQDFYVLGNVIVGDKRTTVQMHRFLMDAPRGLQVDHKNNITTDNRRSNLRIATQSENGMNRKGATCKSTTGHRAVFPYRSTGKFVLRATINGKYKHVGIFSTIDEAIDARDQLPGYEGTNKHGV